MQPHPLQAISRSVQSGLLTIASKCVETIMQLRVDVKKEQTDRFRLVLGDIRRPSKFKDDSPTRFLKELIPKDLYNVLTRLQLRPSSLNYPVTIELSLVNKKTQVRETVECWQLRFTISDELPSSDAYSVGSSELRSLKDFFEELVELLAHLPFWERYWKDNNRRREAKLTHILDFKIGFGEERLPEGFEYEYKHQKLRTFPGLTIKLTAYVRQNIQSLRVSDGSEKSEATCVSPKPVMHKVSGSSGGSLKKHSFYSYEDEYLDVTIISSDTDLSPKSSGIEPVEFIVSQDSSDEEFVIVLESEYDNRRTTFQQRLEELKARAELVDAEYFN